MSNLYVQIALDFVECTKEQKERFLLHLEDLNWKPLNPNKSSRQPGYQGFKLAPSIALFRAFDDAVDAGAILQSSNQTADGDALHRFGRQRLFVAPQAQAVAYRRNALTLF